MSDRSLLTTQKLHVQMRTALPMPVVTRKSSPPPASPHRHKGTGSEAAQGPRKQHGSGSAPSACDPLQGDDGRSDDMHAASLGLSRSDQNDQTCSTLEAM